MTLVINFFGGPGVGKSTVAAGLFSELKQRGISAELVTEYAKDQVWEESFHTMDNQLFMFANQHHRIWRLLGKVDVVVTDSPMLLSMYYGADCTDIFRQLVLEEHNKTSSINILLERNKEYTQTGRIQTEEQATDADNEIKHILIKNNVGFTVLCTENLIQDLADQIIERLQYEKEISWE
jgi:DNA replication protein DnaC